MRSWKKIGAQDFIIQGICKKMTVIAYKINPKKMNETKFTLYRLESGGQEN